MPWSARVPSLTMGVAIAAALTACPARPPQVPVPKKSPATARSAAPAPSAAVATPAVADGRAATNRAPAATRAIEATVRADAGWIIANNGGALISDNGLGAVRLGGSLISDNGLGLIANNGGNVVVAGGQKLISDNGLGLISDNGLGVVAQAQLISDNGLGLVGKTRYALAQAGAPPLGTGRPAAGMVVGLIDPRTGGPVAIGQDDAGQPVYAVFSDGAGKVRLHVPEALAGNLRLVAFPPKDDDARLRFNGIVAAADATATIDDDEAQVAGFIRGAMARRLATMYLQTRVAGSAAQSGIIPAALAAKNPALAALAQPVADQLRATLDALGAGSASPRQVEILMLLMSDRVIADVDLTEVKADAAGGTPEEPLPADLQPVVPTIRTSFRRIAAGAATRLRASATWFDDKPYVIEASRRRLARGGAAYLIRKPTDLVELLVNEYLGTNENRDYSRLNPIFGDLGLAMAEVDRLKQAGEATFLAIGSFMLTGTTQLDGREAPVPDAMFALVRARGPAVLAAADPPIGAGPSVPPAAPPPPAPAVTTLAGTGAKGSADGAGAAATFDEPMGIVVDGNRLLVLDHGSGKLRAIALDDPAHPVTTVATVAGSSLARAADGRLFVGDEAGRAIRLIPAGGGAPQAVADAARGLGDVAGVAVEPSGDLLVVEYEGRRVVRLAAAGFGLTPLLASTGTVRVGFGLAGGEARTGRLGGVVLDPTGRPVVADASLGQIRRLRADGVWELIVGIDAFAYTDGSYMDAEFRNPSGMAYDARGRLIVADAFNHVLRIVSPGGDVSTWAGGAPLAVRNTEYQPGFADGAGPAARFDTPWGVAIGADGTVYVAERGGNRVRAIKPGD